jgi:3-oxoacyl-[acyl-carrier protein] reductase
MSDGRRTAIIAQTANSRAGTAADIAAAVYFLASPAASHITGQLLHVNGGALP